MHDHEQQLQQALDEQTHAAWTPPQPSRRFCAHCAHALRAPDAPAPRKFFGRRALQSAGPVCGLWRDVVTAKPIDCDNVRGDPEMCSLAGYNFQPRLRRSPHGEA